MQRDQSLNRKNNATILPTMVLGVGTAKVPSDPQKANRRRMNRKENVKCEA
jgi:hypothetical protein